MMVEQYILFLFFATMVSDNLIWLGKNSTMVIDLCV